MKLTSREITQLEKMQQRIDTIKSAVADRVHHYRDNNDTETDAVIEGLDCVSAGIEQVIEQYYK